MNKPKPTENEVDIRIKMLNSFLTCPHRDTDKVKLIHEELRQADPLFYAHLACWYLKNGDIRDHNEVFAAMLATDSFIENREVGLALWQNHAPFMKRRILGFVEGRKVKIRTKTGKKTEIVVKGKKKTIDGFEIETKYVGLRKPLPGSFKKERENYLRWLESRPDEFDSLAYKAFDDLKSMYAGGRNGVKPNERAQKILFQEEFPPESKLNVFRSIVGAKTPEEQAKLIIDNKVPYSIAVGLIDKITPTVLVALINSMSSQELINNVASLQARGAYQNPDLKALIDAKLEKATTAKGVSALKSKTAKAAGGVTDESVLKKLDEIADKQIKKAGTIKMSTAVFIDRSGSMEQAIETGKRVASTISGAMEAPLYVVSFSDMPQEIKAPDKTLTAWENAFKPIRAGGGTSIGCALDYLMRAEYKVEQIVVVTDEDERNSPLFVDVLPKYIAKFGITPRIVIIHVGEKYTGFRTALTHRGIEFEVYDPQNADYYALPGLVSFLSRNTKIDLLYEIMGTPLMKRRAWKVEKPKSRKIEIAA